MPVSDRVVVVGGGIGGLAVANAVQRVGLAFDVYERAPALGEVGAGIGLSPAALRVLDVLGLGVSIRAAGHAFSGVVLADRHLRVRRAITSSEPVVCIHRAELVRVLQQGLPAERVHLGREAVAAESGPDAAHVVLADGTRETASCVVVADGVGSAIRRATFPDVRVRPIGQAIWRGIADAPVPDVLRGAFVEIWDGGLRFLTVPMDARRTLWLAVRPEAPGGQDDPATVRDDLCALFAGWHPALLGLVQASPEVLRGDMADLGLPRRVWHCGRVVFSGDAIHATTPNLAQGGCQAIESALALALCLDRFGPGEAAFETFARLRRPKAAHVVRTSWALGRAAHARNPFHHHAMRAVLERAPAAFVRRQEAILNTLAYLRPVDARGLLGPA